MSILYMRPALISEDNIWFTWLLLNDFSSTSFAFATISWTVNSSSLLRSIAVTSTTSSYPVIATS